MVTLNTLAKIETEILESKKTAKSVQKLKIVQKILIGIFLTVFSILLSYIIQNI